MSRSEELAQNGVENDKAFLEVIRASDAVPHEVKIQETVESITTHRALLEMMRTNFGIYSGGYEGHSFL